MGEIKHTEFSKKERTVIYQRDDMRCIMPSCNDKFNINVAHVFVSRAHGGLGIRKNGVLLCHFHHMDLDQRNRPNHDKVKHYTEEYLKFHYGNIKEEDVIYNRFKDYKY